MSRTPRTCLWHVVCLAFLTSSVVALTRAGGAEAGALPWRSIAGGRYVPLAVPTSTREGFALLSPTETGVRFTNTLADATVATNRLLEIGSGVALGDVDGDGRCDMYFCRLEGDNALYRNLGGWRFEDATLGAGVACPGQFSTGCAFADLDGDGDLDLFVGGRAVPGRFPEPAASQLWLDANGAWARGQSFPALGLVSGAVFTDVDDDGDPDLALACEWGPVRLFRNRAGTFEEWQPAVLWPASDAGATSPPPPHAASLAALTGWWTGIAAGDFDGDGRLDLVATNWGRNWRTDQPPGVAAPVHLVYGEFTADGIVHTLLASHDPFLAALTPWREWKAVRAAIPSVVERAPDHHAFGRSDVRSLLGERWHAAQELVATTFDSMLFLNRGDRFEARPLPVEAQFAPAFGLSVADFDGDGHEDLFLAQNFFGVDAETSRQDAGTGLVLLGDGRGGFRALRPTEAGFALYGEQRASAVADFDADGRADLVVTEHGRPARLLRNTGGRAGVRVKLIGPPHNPDAIGAVVRLDFGARVGPARELHAGSGYWAQDSATLTLAAPQAPTALRVRWPQGETQEWPWPADASVVEVSRDGIRPR